MKSDVVDATVGGPYDDFPLSGATGQLRTQWRKRRRCPGTVPDVDTSRRRVLSGPIWAHVQGAPAFRGLRGGADEPAEFPALPAAVDWVLAMLERYGRVSASVRRGSSPWQTVHMVRVGGKQLLLAASHYVGDGPARRQVPNPHAEREVARLLPARGYEPLMLPDPVTPLVALGPLLPSKVLNCLLREGYTSVEQVAALPDAALQDMRSMGAVGIGQVRDAIATLGVRPAVAPAPVTLPAEQAGELARLLSDLAALARTHDERDLAERAVALTRLLTAETTKAKYL